MKYMSHRIGDLELRRAENIKTNEHYLEVVEWMKDEENGDYCYTILTFEGDGEGDHRIESVGERINLDEEKWADLGILIRFGFMFLNKNVKEGESEQ